MSTYTKIAKAIGLSYNTVQHICRFKPLPDNKKKYGPDERKLEQ